MGLCGGRFACVLCYDHALLVTGYDVLLLTLQGNPSFSTSSVSSFVSTHAGPDYFSLLTFIHTMPPLIRLMPRTPIMCTASRTASFLVISIPPSFDVIMTYDSDPDSNPILSMTSSLTDPL